MTDLESGNTSDAYKRHGRAIDDINVKDTIGSLILPSLL
jgi:hypothetical protein